MADDWKKAFIPAQLNGIKANTIHKTWKTSAHLDDEDVEARDDQDELYKEAVRGSAERVPEEDASSLQARASESPSAHTWMPEMIQAAHEARIMHLTKLAETGVCDLPDSRLRPASRRKTREYLNLSAGLAGDDWGRGVHSA